MTIPIKNTLLFLMRYVPSFLLVEFPDKTFAILNVS